VEQAYNQMKILILIAKWKWRDNGYNQQQAGIQAAEGTKAADKITRVRLDGLRQQVISLERVTAHRHRVTL